jgi:hypothetical protein
MIDKEQDPNLQAPQEANTTKHFNFLESEESTDNTSVGSDSDAGNNSPTKKAWEELRQDQENKQESNT